MTCYKCHKEGKDSDFTYASKTGRYRGEYGYAFCSACIKKLDKHDA